MRKAALIVALSSTACSGSPAGTGTHTSSGTGTSTSTSSTSGAGTMGAATSISSSSTSGAFTEAPHPSLPLIVNAGGPVMTNPVIVPLLYQEDPNVTKLQTYLQYLATNGPFVSELTQYGLVSVTTAASLPIQGAVRRDL